MLLVFILSYFSIVNTSGDSRSILFLEMILWVALIVILYVNIKNYDDNNLDFQTKFKNLFNSKLAEMEVTSSKGMPHGEGKKKDNAEDEDENGKEVFHLPENKYTYKEAHDACKSLNARLATYDDRTCL